MEQNSGYRPVFPPNSPNAEKNPVAFSYMQIRIAGQMKYLLSRVAYAGLDYSGRSNKIAHHILTEEHERSGIPGGPVSILMNDKEMCSEWKEEPKELDQRKPTPVELIPGPATKWAEILGDAGWAGVIAEWFKMGKEQVYVVFEPGQEILPLVQEISQLLDEDERWKFTFNTYFIASTPGIKCFLRFCVKGSEIAEKAERLPKIPLVLHLEDGPGKNTDTEYQKILEDFKDSNFVQTARTGTRPEPPPQPELVPPQPELPETDDAPIPILSAASDDAERPSPTQSDTINGTRVMRYKRPGGTYSPCKERRSRMSGLIITVGITALVCIAGIVFYVVDNQKTKTDESPGPAPSHSDTRSVPQPPLHGLSQEKGKEAEEDGRETTEGTVEKAAESSQEKAPADSTVTPTKSDPEPQEGTRETALPITPPSPLPFPSRPGKEPKPSALTEKSTEPAPKETEPVIHQVYEDAAPEQRLAFMLAWEKAQEISTGGNAKALSGMLLLENATGPLQVEMTEIGKVIASNLPRSVYLSESEGGNRIDIFAIVKPGHNYARDQTLGPALTLRNTDGCLRLDRNIFPDPGPAKVPSLTEVAAIIVGGKRFPTQYDSDLVKPHLTMTDPEISLIGNHISVRFQPTETQKTLLTFNEYGKTTHKFKLSDARNVKKIDPWSFRLEAKRYSNELETVQRSIDSFNDVLKKERNQIEDLRKELTELKKKPPTLKNKKADWSFKIDSIADRITKMQNESADEKSTRRKKALLSKRNDLLKMGHKYPNPTDTNKELFENYIDGIGCADEGWITLQGIDESLGGGIRNSIKTGDFRLLIEKK
jgi:hypothetical protein